MTEIKNVQGSKESAKPIIEQKTTVYVHTNIQKLDNDLYQYDEKQFSLEEWEDVKEVYYSEERQKAIEEQVTSLEAAMCDIYELLLNK